MQEVTRYSKTIAGLCKHCGAEITDGQSPTGLVHVSTGRTRCDGKDLPRRWSPDEFDLAVLR